MIGFFIHDLHISEQNLHFLFWSIFKNTHVFPAAFSCSIIRDEHDQILQSSAKVAEWKCFHGFCFCIFVIPNSNAKLCMPLDSLKHFLVHFKHFSLRPKLTSTPYWKSLKPRLRFWETNNNNSSFMTPLSQISQFQPIQIFERNKHLCYDFMNESPSHRAPACNALLIHCDLWNSW